MKKMSRKNFTSLSNLAAKAGMGGGSSNANANANNSGSHTPPPPTSTPSSSSSSSSSSHHGPSHSNTPGGAARRSKGPSWADKVREKLPELEENEYEILWERGVLGVIFLESEKDGIPYVSKATESCISPIVQTGDILKYVNVVRSKDHSFNEFFKILATMKKPVLLRFEHARSRTATVSSSDDDSPLDQRSGSATLLRDDLGPGTPKVQRANSLPPAEQPAKQTSSRGAFWRTVKAKEPPAAPVSAPAPTRQASNGSLAHQDTGFQRRTELRVNTSRDVDIDDFASQNAEYDVRWESGPLGLFFGEDRVTNLPVVTRATASASELVQRKVSIGDTLVSANGVPSSEFSFEAFFARLQKMNKPVKLIFRKEGAVVSPPAVTPEARGRKASVTIDGSPMPRKHSSPIDDHRSTVTGTLHISPQVDGSRTPPISPLDKKPNGVVSKERATTPVKQPKSSSDSVSYRSSERITSTRPNSGAAYARSSERIPFSDSNLDMAPSSRSSERIPFSDSNLDMAPSRSSERIPSSRPIAEAPVPRSSERFSSHDAFDFQPSPPGSPTKDASAGKYAAVKNGIAVLGSRKQTPPRASPPAPLKDKEARSNQSSKVDKPNGNGSIEVQQESKRESPVKKHQPVESSPTGNKTPQASPREDIPENVPVSPRKERMDSPPPPTSPTIDDNDTVKIDSTEPEFDEDIPKLTDTKEKTQLELESEELDDKTELPDAEDTEPMDVIATDLDISADIDGNDMMPSLSKAKGGAQFGSASKVSKAVINANLAKYKRRAKNSRPLTKLPALGEAEALTVPLVAPNSVNTSVQVRGRTKPKTSMQSTPDSTTYLVKWKENRSIGLQLKEVRWGKGVFPLVTDVCQEACCEQLKHVCIGDVIVEINGRNTSLMGVKKTVNFLKTCSKTTLLKFRHGPGYVTQRVSASL